MPLAGLLRSSLDYWWVLVVRGALAVLFGVLALAWPHITVVVLIALFAAFAFLDGISSIISAVQRFSTCQSTSVCGSRRPSNASSRSGQAVMRCPGMAFSRAARSGPAV